jgi:hypothetical protein
VYWQAQRDFLARALNPLAPWAWDREKLLKLNAFKDHCGPE